jgi:hypothetical protein
MVYLVFLFKNKQVTTLMDQLIVFGGAALGVLNLYQKSLLNKNHMLIENVDGSFGGNRVNGYIPTQTELPQAYTGRVSFAHQEAYDYSKRHGHLDQYKEMDEYYRTVQPGHWAMDPDQVKERVQYPERSQLYTE